MAGQADTKGEHSPGVAVLIVDDHRGLAEALAERLAMEGFTAAVATSGAEGLRSLATRPFDAAFVDLLLPDASGLSVISAMRERCPGLKVILMTGMADFLDSSVVSRIPLDGMLTKPWSARELASVLRRLTE